MCAVAEGGAGINEVLITTLNEPSAGIGSVVMTYWDFDQDYAANTATAKADTAIDTITTNVGEEQIGIPFVMTEAEANSPVRIRLASRA